MTTLHDQESVFSVRHVPSWLMLTFASGSVNAAALVACERYVTHVTGTVTRLGMAATHVGLLLDFAAVLVAFIAGAATSALLVNARVRRGKQPRYASALFMVCAITAAVGILGHAGVLGEFGGPPDETGDFVFLSALSFASGLQNAAVATATGMLVRTTHLTGPATDLGIHLVDMALSRGDARKRAIAHVLLRCGKIAAFAIGAGAGFALAHRVAYLAFLTPAAIVGVVTVTSFLSPVRTTPVDSLAEAE